MTMDKEDLASRSAYLEVADRLADAGCFGLAEEAADLADAVTHGRLSLARVSWFAARIFLAMIGALVAAPFLPR